MHRGLVRRDGATKRLVITDAGVDSLEAQGIVIDWQACAEEEREP